MKVFNNLLTEAKLAGFKEKIPKTTKTAAVTTGTITLFFW